MVVTVIEIQRTEEKVTVIFFSVKICKNSKEITYQIKT